MAAPRLSGKVVAVTGATSGIGRAVALGAAAEGADVMVVGRHTDRAADVVGTIEAAGRRAVFRPTDLSEWDAGEAFVADCIAELGRVDVLVNAAGWFEGGPTGLVTHRMWEEAMAVNLRSVFFAGQAALEHMAERGSGSVVNISSMGAFAGFPDAAVYCAAKGAIEALTRAWACEYGRRGVNVNSVAPGTVDTGMTAKDPEGRRFLQGLSVLGRLADAEEIAPAVLFLASDEARYVLGQCIVVDGGWKVRVGSGLPNDV